MSTTVVLQLPASEAARLRTFLTEREFQFRDVPHATLAAKGLGCSVTHYQSGKLVVQGKTAAELARAIGAEVAMARLPAELAPAREVAAPDQGELLQQVEAAEEGGRLPPPLSEAEARMAKVGSDESGKGDYFGPLVVSALYAPPGAYAVLRELGVRDSKTLKDRDIARIAATLEAAYPTATIIIPPHRYNDLRQQRGNLNHLLAWAHGRAIAEVVEQVDQPVRLAVTDQFGPARLVEGALEKEGLQLPLRQRPRGEGDPAVAAASMLARAAFCRRLRQLGDRFGVTLPKGAGRQVDAAGRKLVEEQGREALGQVAKLHFKNTQRVLGA